MKALVIGLDGATFTVLTPLMEAGFMPNLRQTVLAGVSAELLSTVPPVTALAWPSFMTGKNPGKHGLMGWQGRLNAHFERPWISGHQVRGSKLWHMANRAGLRTCVVNVPVTYPPEPLDGVMITGMLTPGLGAEFTYPAELKTALLAAVPDYQVDVDVQRVQPDTRNKDAIRRFVAQVLSVTQARGKAVRWLLEREQPDLAIVVFELPDRLQHILWRYIEQLPSGFENEKASTPVREGLLACYRALDEEIGRLLDHLPSESYLCLLSDHGFGPLETNVYLSDWLAQAGWLAYSGRQARVREASRWLGSRIKRWLPGSLKWKARQALPLLGTLDWDRTLAYPGLPTEYGIFLNVKGREPAGIVESIAYESLRTEIIQALYEWHDHRAAGRIVKAVSRREELYSGPFVDQAPDIVFELERGYRVSDLTGRGALLGDISHEPWGFHEREGILIIRGPGVGRAGRIERAEIQDVMPTLLHALGLPVPDDLDGRVLLEVFDADWRSAHPVRFQPAVHAEEDIGVRHPFSVEDEALIEERLKGLGYLE